MLRHLFCAAVVIGVLAGRAGAAEPNSKFGGDNAEWGALPKSQVVIPPVTEAGSSTPPKRCWRTPPPMFGDIITCGFNQGC